MKDQTLALMDQIFQITRLVKHKMSFPSNLMQLSHLQIQTLTFLQQRKATTMSNIAEYLQIELPSATSLINKLVAMHLVKRTSNQRDRRVVGIVLSDKGTELLKQAIELRRKKMEEMMSYLSDKQQSDLLSILQTLLNCLQSRI
jgi:DNA-binding MarR family transcriptional regulator